MVTDMVTGVEVSLFKDAFEALRMLASDVRSLTRIPKARRDEAITAIADAYQVLDLGTSLVIARLGKVIERGDIGNDGAFATELAALQSAQEWFEMESRVALCSTLRVHRQELSRTFSGAVGRASMKDWKEADRQMAAVLDHEGVLAQHITSTLIDLSNMAGPATKSKAGFKRALEAVKSARDGLVAQRRDYIRAEVELLQAI